jgi:hypothetical protein
LRRGAARRAAAGFFGAAARAGAFRAAARRFGGFGGRARRAGLRRATAGFRAFFAGFAAGRRRTGLARRADRPRAEADFALGDRRDRARFLAAITALPRRWLTSVP